MVGVEGCVGDEGLGEAGFGRGVGEVERAVLVEGDGLLDFDYLELVGLGC